jgi:hypothetical protein
VGSGIRRSNAARWASLSLLRPNSLPAREGRRDAFERLVLQCHGEAALCRPGGDVAAHDAGADHVQPVHGHVRFLAEGLQPFLEKEDANKIARGRRADDAVNDFRSRQGIAVVLLPEVDDGVGRRVVLGPGTGGHLLFGLRGDDGFEQTVHQTVHERTLFPRAIGEHQLARGGLHQARRHAVVGEPQALGLAGVDVAAGKHHVERRAWRDELRQALHAAPAGEDTQHDFGQGELGTGFVDDDAVAAGERQFDAATHAVTANQGKGWPGHAGKSIEEMPAALDQGPSGGGIAEAGELLDIGAGDETGALAGSEDQPLGRSALKFVEKQGQFGHYIGRQRVGAGAGLVECCPGDAVGIAFEFPVLVAHSFSRSIAPPRPPPMQMVAMPF